MKRKPKLELSGEYLSESENAHEVGLLSTRNFFHLDDARVAHLVEVPGQGTQLIEVAPEYLQDLDYLQAD
jgi:hypothetical protein